MKLFMFLGFLGHTLGCLPGFSRIFTNKFKDLTKKQKMIFPSLVSFRIKGLVLYRLL